MVMVGADPDELDRIAGQLEAEARRLENLCAQLGRQLHSAPWKGARADRFRSDWNSTHTRRVRDAAGFLRAGGDALMRNATEQRNASNSGGGSTAGPLCEVPKQTPPDSLKPDQSDEYLEPFKTFFEGLGLADDVWNGLVKLLRVVDPSILKDLGKFLAGHPEMLGFFKATGKVLDIGSVILDFAVDISKQLGTNHLPMDEAILHSMVFAGMKFAESEGIEKLGQMLGSSLGSVIPVLGTAGGGLVGWAAGYGLSMILEAVDGKFGLNEQAADAATAAYREVKELAGAVGEFVGDVGEAIGDAYDDVKDVVGDVKDGAEDFIDDVSGAMPWNW